MQKKLLERQGPASQSVSAPDITVDNDHSGRKVSDWTGDFGELGLTNDQLALPRFAPKEALSNNAEQEQRFEAAAEDCLMNDEQAAPQDAQS